jgi:hypothetical protein
LDLFCAEAITRWMNKEHVTVAVAVAVAVVVAVAVAVAV